MRAAALFRKQQDSVSSGEKACKRFTAYFCLLVPSKTGQTQQFTRFGMFLWDFTFYSSLRFLKNASNKYWMSKHQHYSFKFWRLFECLPPLCVNCGILAISDSPFYRKCAECKIYKWDFPWKSTPILVLKQKLNSSKNCHANTSLWIPRSTQSKPFQQLVCCVVDRKMREKRKMRNLLSAQLFTLLYAYLRG